MALSWPNTPSTELGGKSVRCSLALSGGGLKDVKGCASSEPTCPPPRALQPAWFASCLESESPGLLRASRALGGRKGRRSPQHQVWRSRPPSSSAVLSALTRPGLLCPPAVPWAEGAVLQMQPAPPAPDSSPTPNALPGGRAPTAPRLTSCLPAPFLASSQHPSSSQPFSHPSSSHFHSLAHYRPSLPGLSGAAVPPD